VVLARTAARARKLALAQRLLEEACARNSRSAGQAWLALAQLHADALGQADKAREIYGRIVVQFPGTDAAKLAAAQGVGADRGVTG
jgi:TolA-binding protein